jgi:hypothetical protein
MGFFRIHSVWNETNTFPNSKDMRIDREDVSPHAKKKEAVDGFWADPIESFQGLLDLFGTHLF